jgi:hypothetical protein
MALTASEKEKRRPEVAFIWRGRRKTEERGEGEEGLLVVSVGRVEEGEEEEEWKSVRREW